MIGRWSSFWDGEFLEAMLVLVSVVCPSPTYCQTIICSFCSLFPQRLEKKRCLQNRPVLSDASSSAKLFTKTLVVCCKLIVQGILPISGDFNMPWKHDSYKPSISFECHKAIVDVFRCFPCFCWSFCLIAWPPFPLPIWAAIRRFTKKGRLR